MARAGDILTYAPGRPGAGQYQTGDTEPHPRSNIVREWMRAERKFPEKHHGVSPLDRRRVDTMSNRVNPIFATEGRRCEPGSRDARG
jgi:hypothetical protein